MSSCRVRIPGPAGDVVAPAVGSTDFSPHPFKVQDRIVEPDIQSSKNNEANKNFSQTPAWMTMLGSNHHNPPPLALLADLAKTGSEQKLARLAVSIVSVECIYDAYAIFRDTSGFMQGTIHRKAIKEHRSLLEPGTVLVLENVTIFSPTESDHFLNICSSNIDQVFPYESMLKSSTSLSPDSSLEISNVPQGVARARECVDLQHRCVRQRILMDNSATDDDDDDDDPDDSDEEVFFEEMEPITAFHCLSSAVPKPLPDDFLSPPSVVDYMQADIPEEHNDQLCSGGTAANLTTPKENSPQLWKGLTLGPVPQSALTTPVSDLSVSDSEMDLGQGTSSTKAITAPFRHRSQPHSQRSLSQTPEMGFTREEFTQATIARQPTSLPLLSEQPNFSSGSQQQPCSQTTASRDPKSILLSQSIQFPEIDMDELETNGFDF